VGPIPQLPGRRASRSPRARRASGGSCRGTSRPSSRAASPASSTWPSTAGAGSTCWRSRATAWRPATPGSDPSHALPGTGQVVRIRP